MSSNTIIRRACTAMALLAGQGFVVTAMQVGNFNAVITVEPPHDPTLLAAVPVIAVTDERGRHSMQVVRYHGCLVQWQAPEVTSATSVTSPLILKGFRLVTSTGPLRKEVPA